MRAQEVYFTRDMQNHHGGVVFVNGYLYGFHNAILTCLEFATGKVMWRNRSVGKGSLAYADGSLYLWSENNVVGLADASPAAYRETGRFRLARAGLAVVGAPGHQRRAPVHPRSGYPYRLQHPGKLGGSG